MGPICLVRTGDVIKVDIPAGTIQLDVPDEELQNRQKGLVITEKTDVSDCLMRYANSVKAATTGATIKCNRGLI